jgi:drug/metabolite transporter (DMT)-like permease
MGSSGWLFLTAMIVAYGAANLLQSVAVSRTRQERKFHPSLLLKLCEQRIYLIGVGCQMLGFVLAFLARRDLPLFLVQASVAAGLGVTAILGVLVLKWRLPPAELALLGLLCFGITGLVIAARPAPSRAVGSATVIGIGVALVLIGVIGRLATRLRGSPGSVALGSLAGLCFGAAAVASRPLASVHSWDRFFTAPLLYLLIAHSLLGQLLLGLAMQHGSTTAAVAAMDAAAAVPAALIGLFLLGDEIWPGREWLAALGFLATLAAVLGMTRYATPQHHHPVKSRRSVSERLAHSR